jgi:hypothetical protein
MVIDDDIKVEFKETGWQSFEWNYVAEGGDLWWAHRKHSNLLDGSIKFRDFLM